MSDLKRLIVLWIVAVLLFTAICLLIRLFIRPPAADSRLLYHDQVKMAGAAASYADVAPP